MRPQDGKPCGKCGVWKDYRDYYAGSAEGGRHRWCIDCYKAYVEERRLRKPRKVERPEPKRHNVHGERPKYVKPGWRATPLYVAVPRQNGHAKPVSEWTEGEWARWRAALGVDDKQKRRERRGVVKCVSDETM